MKALGDIASKTRWGLQRKTICGTEKGKSKVSADLQNHETGMRKAANSSWQADAFAQIEILTRLKDTGQTNANPVSFRTVSCTRLPFLLRMFHSEFQTHKRAKKYLLANKNTEQMNNRCNKALTWFCTAWSLCSQKLTGVHKTISVNLRLLWKNRKECFSNYTLLTKQWRFSASQ